MKQMMMLGALVVFLTVFTPLNIWADPPGGGCDPLDPACPIDGGLTLLIAAGIGLGAKKAMNNKKENR
jgi:hypothetical protein